MAEPSVVLVVNPKASAVTPESIARVVGRIRACVPTLRVVSTEGPMHAADLSAAACSDESVQSLLVYAGDGGFNEVFNGLTRKLPVGLIPGGRTNVLPRALGVSRDPIRAVDEALDALAAGRKTEISLGTANGRKFAFSAGVGLDAEFVRAWDALPRRSDGGKRGDLAFLRAAFSVLRSKGWHLPPLLEVESFGRAAFVTVANCNPYSYLGRLPLRIAPRARLERGLDLVAPFEVRPRSIPRLLAYAVLGKGQTMASDVIYVNDLSRISVTCSTALPMHADGEDLGDVRHVEFECRYRAATILR